jgi:D-alanyl-D-alanine carboxypeptidase/D-alanyl-D-alanine-endopeptidase (penicillin-binding protein 4)
VSRSRITAALVLIFIVCASGASARPYWKKRIDRLTAGRPISVVLADNGHRLYERQPRAQRIPASNQKLIASMALLDALGPGARLRTSALASNVDNGVIDGNMWIVGRGDPAVGGVGFGGSLPFEPTRLSDLARRIDAVGVKRIRGRIVGSTTYFTHDWYAPGWEPDFPARYVALPSALTFNSNTWDGRHIDNPELRAARALTKRLKDRGIKVYHRARAGRPPSNTKTVARVRSRPLKVLLRYMNRQSSNFYAEVLGKRLAVERYGPPGTIAKGAAAAQAFAAENGVDITALDSSGLSYDNRVTAGGVARLLRAAEQAPWGDVLRRTLAAPGQGTLEDRPMPGVRMRAKTGTLENVSTLSGYVWLRKSKTWAEFSILSGGMPKSTASSIEDRVISTVARSAR